MELKNLKTPLELMQFLEKNIKYGYLAEGRIFTEPFISGDMDKYYRLRTDKDLINTGYGVCWDVVELERSFFEHHKIEHECYFIQAFKTRAEGGPTHTILLFKEEDKWKWFEYTWTTYAGIHEYQSKKDALEDILKKHLQYATKEQNDIRLYKYQKAQAGLNTFEFINHCYTGESIPLTKNKRKKENGLWIL